MVTLESLRERRTPETLVSPTCCGPVQVRSKKVFIVGRNGMNTPVTTYTWKLGLENKETELNKQ